MPLRGYAQRFRESRWEQDIGWTIAWTLSGFQRVDVAEKKAAYFMSTDPGDDPDVLACKPWDAYTIEIPDGLIEVPFAEGLVSFGIISVWHLKDGAQTSLIVRSRNAERTIIGPRVFPPLPIKLDPDNPAKKPADRAIELIAALAFMTEIRMSARNNDDETDAGEPPPPSTNTLCIKTPNHERVWHQDKTRDGR